jgi:hypothetical protein
LATTTLADDLLESFVGNSSFGVEGWALAASDVAFGAGFDGGGDGSLAGAAV